MKKLFEAARSKDAVPSQSTFSLWEKVRYPGLTTASGEIDELVEQLPKRWAVFSYKQSRTFVWVAFMGGTGTGKSTIFNALCRKMLSETGVERPKTFGPILYAHRDIELEEDFPFRSMEIRHIAPDEATSFSHAGAAGQMMVLEHARGDLAHLALMDTPDLDSLETRNRQMVEDLYLLSDVIVFVTSQEKYADEVPFDFLKRVRQEEKSYFLVLNKAVEMFTREEVLASFRAQGLDLRDDRLWILPYTGLRAAAELSASREFKKFASAFLGMLSRKEVPRLLKGERKRRLQQLGSRTDLLIDLLEKENAAAEGWLGELDAFFKVTCEKLLAQQRQHFSAESREYLQNEIRRLYSRYDVLGKPRRLVSQVILSPLRLLGLWGPRRQESRTEALARIRQRIDLLPIQVAVDDLNRFVLERLSPSDERSPLFKVLRRPDMMLGHEEIKNQVYQEQERLALWLEEQFQKLARGIPKSKEWGIYSTSILWGGLILSFETAIGGGISLVEAVLDSALAPFVTRGAVELFAYQELQKIARELAKRYQEGLLSVVRLQKDRYVKAIRSLMTSPETISSIREHWSAISRQ